MCDCVKHVCQKCCCNCSCTDINLWIVIIVGGIITIGMFLLYSYFSSKYKGEDDIDRAMLGLPPRSKRRN